MRIYLTGFMGSGKSSVGRLLATKMAVPFLDLDQEIERNLSTSIVEIFETHGEEYFRIQERTELRRIQNDPIVVATGGGCFVFNREWMLQNGTVIFLKVPFSDIAKRIGADPARPLWKNAEKLYEVRSIEYEKAQLVVDASGTPEEVVETIMRLLPPESKKIPGS